MYYSSGDDIFFLSLKFDYKNPWPKNRLRLICTVYLSDVRPLWDEPEFDRYYGTTYVEQEEVKFKEKKSSSFKKEFETLLSSEKELL